LIGVIVSAKVTSAADTPSTSVASAALRSATCWVADSSWPDSGAV
jgi:hypothetical protein